MKSLLEKLKIQPVNAGACAGVDGWLMDENGKELISYNPTTGEAIAKVIQATPATYEKVASAAHQAFLDWRHVPAPKRGELVRDLGNALRELKEPLGDLVTVEMGKIRAEGWGEVQEMIDICDFAVGQSRMLYGLSMHSERSAHRMYEQWHPLGILGLVTAFNFPVAVWSWNSALAAICGDTVMWKPSSYTPLTAIAVTHIANKVMADHGLSGIFNLVVGSGRDVGELMLNDKRIPLVSFTGSTSIGTHVSETVARRFGRTILELGGNNAIIVTPNADLDMATRAILFGAVGTAGQRCTSTRRIIMQKTVARELSNRLVNAYKQVRIGDPLQPDTLMGPLVVNTSVEEMMDAVNKAKADGGEVLTGGEMLPELGPNFVTPAIIRMPAQTEIVRTETFAPILYLLEYETIEEALRIHNDVPQGLSSAIFTDSVREAETFLSVGGSDCGIANVNIGTSGAEIGGAFGGEKETGGGRESGSDAWKVYMRRQTNTINWSKELPLAQGIKFGD
ncbi:MAG: aldehyde dehydrogenase family protein [Chloroflexi bacterium]|nr:aldehyde dehydrogenase family protein [Chloroflexi bacterium CFX1]MCK6568299.1 aldehyde dehydrogenase family protein [Anaerolineales bacterium]MCQ3953030.1 aldehyde dehydrogenase family protein [Chloroflexota bacterium]MDL1920198.1 aldehyde dehydrogenase family protein [Chloroflexi bacterium CFX5]NUQ59573.1 aldehyde dehydrogenase family protein [Anaerolineales bacterium]